MQDRRLHIKSNYPIRPPTNAEVAAVRKGRIAFTNTQMTAGFLVTTTSRFDRELRKLVSKHDSLSEVFKSVIETLEADPYNRSRQRSIKKLEAVASNEGQYRIRS